MIENSRPEPIGIRKLRVKFYDAPPLYALRYEEKFVPYERIADGSGTARGKGTKEGWISGLEIARLPLERLDDYPAICRTVALLANTQGKTIQQVMVNKLHRESSLDKHRDGPPQHFRWHFPIYTNPAVTWWDEYEGSYHMSEGEWWGPVNYCGILHSMSNPSRHPRVHLIVDLL